MNSGRSTLEKRKSSIHIVIPTLNEAVYIGQLLTQLQEFDGITVVDGASTDETAQILRASNIDCTLNCERGRAVQMNRGARESKADYLLFLHADTALPENFKSRLEQFIERHEPIAGSFRLAFRSRHWFLKLNAYFSHLNFLAFQFGDQGLLVKQDVFKQLGGFNEQLSYMEGNDMIKRIKQDHFFQKIPITIRVSARKYQAKGVFRLQFSYYLIYTLTRLGVSQNKVKRWFKSIL